MLSVQFVGIGDNIFGEECNKFTNTLGESVEVTIKENIAETTTLLGTLQTGQAASTGRLFLCALISPKPT